MRMLARLCCALALSATLSATTFLPLSFEQLVDGSSLVVYGRVVDVRSQWTEDRRFIESVVSMEVLRGMKGSAGERVAFTVPGGRSAATSTSSPVPRCSPSAIRPLCS